MAERSISQELRLKNIDEAKTYFIEETIENDFTMCGRIKNLCHTTGIEKYKSIIKKKRRSMIKWYC